MRKTKLCLLCLGTQTWLEPTEQPEDVVVDDDCSESDESLSDVEMDSAGDRFDDPVFTDSEPEVVSAGTEDLNLEDSFNTR